MKKLFIIVNLLGVLNNLYGLVDEGCEVGGSMELDVGCDTVVHFQYLPEPLTLTLWTISMVWYHIVYW